MSTSRRPVLPLPTRRSRRVHRNPPLAALPEQVRQAVADVYANAFTPLFIASCAIALIGLCAALMLKPTQLPRVVEVRPAASAEAAE